MKFRYPAYYDSFACIAGRCENTCCAGWEIDIDDESYEYYMSVEGELGERLRASIKEYGREDGDSYEQHGFVLGEDKRCPFLDRDGLCVLYRELGEGALCDVCADTPRNYLEYGGDREVSVSASCPEAARLIYGNQEKTVFVEKEADGELDFEESAQERELAVWVRRARDREIEILQDRTQPIGQRIIRFLSYAAAVQERLNGGDLDGLPGVGDSPVDPLEDMPSVYELFLRRMVSFTGLESVSEEWEKYLGLLQEKFIRPPDGAETYRVALAQLTEELRRQGREYEYEHLMVYYAFMCLPRCVDDYDFLGKAKLAAVSFLVTRDLDAVHFAACGSYTKEDRIKIAGLYAREVEHSEHNLEYLADEFLFEEAYEPAPLCRAAGLDNFVKRV